MAAAPRAAAAAARQARLAVAATAAADTPTEAPPAFTPEKPTLFGVPISNCAARNRFVIYKKGLEGEVDIQAPKLLGDKGVKSPAYLALNPQGKMPLLVLPDGTPLPESQVIEEYLLVKYAGVGPSLRPPTPELYAKAMLASRIHDLYIQPLQGCMYKKMDAADRCDQLQSIAFQLDVLEDVVAGPFVAGEEISFGDAALFPTFVFFTEILPKHFGWPGVFGGRPKLAAWWEAVQKDPEAARVVGEMRSGLADWESAKRWDNLGISAQVADGSFNWSCS
ncbi:glutathione S-transferase [Micractinium conductrix]|uniref:Glutathione S-transferase n=1 Tax=Micractinium conductrix TaxID=554055 RepID=A0A2P6VGR8_9CHLO|nr:glutathione S-transferase [Micractinium conductrix]PSC73281.1 glutathione S-transferase [Micractinium conductrix]|eukprot:PSC73230.1 glutathione S-transferase [Micractinium conductrix]